MTERFFPYALFGGLLAMAGLPIYIHAPKFYVDEYGTSLAALGAVLFGLRLLDVVQDPALGWLSRRTSHKRAIAVTIATAAMALSMLGLFAVAPPINALVWFALMLAGLFSAFSFLTITFYAQGVTTAKTLTGEGHVRLAGWRETGALLGVSLASVLPVALLGVTERPFALFAALFAVLAVIGVLSMRRKWRPGGDARTSNLKPILADPLARRLLLIALLNATPVAVSSTLFLFFVESRLEAPGWEGPLLLLFFLAAAASAPVWSRVAQRHGSKWTLKLGMVLAIASFGWAATLGAGDQIAFAVICIVSGAALGADMTLLPALFAKRTSEIAPEAAEGFGLWSFVSKFSLAFAAVVLLPLLDASGFQAGQMSQPEQALQTLTLSYAVLPCVLKLGALLLLSATPLEDVEGTALNRGTP
ncbi:MAG: MFS transporter [Paracoccaceae bacterium]|nr:MFS transporter [Paracoccaceae bacterium]